MLLNSTTQGARAVKGRRSTSLCIAASFSFADSKRVKAPEQGRRNRTIEKRQESELRSLVHGLCKMNNRQLQAVSHLLSEEHVQQIKIAMNIPPTNQGRRRQEALVMKLLRGDQDNLNLDKIAQAVTAAERNNLTYTDTDVEQQLRYWMEGLISNDQEVVDEVYQVLQQHNLDWQQLRTWVRQVQQHQQQQQAQQQQQTPVDAVVGPSSNSNTTGTANSSGTTSTASQQDPEVQQLMLELAEQQQQKQQQRRAKSSKGHSSSSSVSAVRRSIRRLLKPLAVELCT